MFVLKILLVQLVSVWARKRLPVAEQIRPAAADNSKYRQLQHAVNSTLSPGYSPSPDELAPASSFVPFSSVWSSLKPSGCETYRAAEATS